MKNELEQPKAGSGWEGRQADFRFTRKFFMVRLFNEKRYKKS